MIGDHQAQGSSKDHRRIPLKRSSESYWIFDSKPVLVLPPSYTRRQPLTLEYPWKEELAEHWHASVKITNRDLAKPKEAWRNKKS